jgi:hypothetical protein
VSRASHVLSLAAAIALVSGIRASDGDEDALKAVYKSIETAVRNGDGQLWLRLQSKNTLDEMPEQAKQNILQGGYRDPSIRYEPIVVRVQSNDAILIGRFIRTSQPGASYTYESVRFAREGGEWKITAEASSNTPLDPNSIWALLPPEDGAFARAQSPWPRIPYAGLNTKFFNPSQLNWKMQATVDESFLYVRFEAASALPAPGLEIHKSGNSPLPETGAPPGPPWMVVTLGEGGPTPKSMEFQTGVQVETRSTFDKAGKANSYRYFVSYSLSAWQPTHAVQAGNQIFNRSTTDSDSFSLIFVHDRFLDVRIPLKAVGWSAARPPAIRIQEYNSSAQIRPYQVSEFKP